VDEVEHFESEVDDERIEEVFGDGVETLHVDRSFAQTRSKLIHEHHQGDAGNHGGKQKDDGHERSGPPGIGFDRAEDEADITVEHESGGDTDEGDDPAYAIVHIQ